MYRIYHERQQPQQIPGTSSILSHHGKKPNHSLIQQIWQYDHDPNDSFLTPIINQKLRKHHSTQDCIPRGGGGRSQLGGEQNQYHSMLQDSNMGAKYRGEYGISRGSQHGKEGLMDMEGQLGGSAMGGGSKMGYANQLQRVLGISYGSKLSAQPNRQAKNTPKTLESPSPVMNDFMLSSEIQPYALPQSLQSPSTYPAPSREQDILAHKKTSNINYLMRQIKQLMQLVKMEWIQGELEETRSGIIKMEIECRRLRISLRTSTSLTKIKAGEKKEDNTGNASLAVMNEYGYFNTLQSKSRSPHATKRSFAHRFQNSLTPNSKSKHMKNSISNSNLIKIQSKINNDSLETVLISQIQKQKNMLIRLKQKEEKLNSAIKAAGQRESNRRNSKSSKKKIEEIQTEQTFNRKPQPRQRSKKLKDTGYLQLLAQKRNVIKDTMQKFKLHYDYKANKLHQQTAILRQQLKIVQDKIYEMGMTNRPRTKHSVSGQKNSAEISKRFQKPQPINKPSTNQVSQYHKTIPTEPTSSTSRRKLLLRSPSDHQSCQQVDSPQQAVFPVTVLMPTNYEVRQLNLRRVCSHEVICYTNPDIDEESEKVDRTDKQESTERKIRCSEYMEMGSRK